ncbi:MAG: hypothetical protein M3Z26_05045 [Bacteroidota bacterium]|nr:hypothetical protein [Bacteroidota bacterium]
MNCRKLTLQHNKFSLQKILRHVLIFTGLFAPVLVFAQADNEIQVYSSPITPKAVTFVELHQNYTFQGSKYLADKNAAHWINETLEITRGFGDNFELGFYTFTGFSPDGKYVFLGNHIRPRFTIPASWGWKVGASLSMEIGYIKPDGQSTYVMDGELRPIIDKTIGKIYLDFNPNIGFVFTGPGRHAEIAPQFKIYYNVLNKFGLGVEYYSALGTFGKIANIHNQEHIIGPMFNLLSSVNWELETGFLFGLTPGSNHQIFKLLIGRRFGK